MEVFIIFLESLLVRIIICLEVVIICLEVNIIWRKSILAEDGAAGLLINVVHTKAASSTEPFIISNVDRRPMPNWPCFLVILG